MVTKVSKNKTLENIKFTVNSIYENNPLLKINDKSKQLLSYMKDNVFIFHVPQHEGVLEYADIFDNINQSMQFLDLKPL